MPQIEFVGRAAGAVESFWEGLPHLPAERRLGCLFRRRAQVREGVGRLPAK